MGRRLPQDDRGQRGEVHSQPQHLVQDVREALSADPQLAALDLRVRIVDDEVYLQGVVATEERRERAGAIATRVLPHHRLHNDVLVLDALDAADEEHLS
jgi:hypothetical protein